MKKLFKSKRGAMPILFIGLVFLMLMMTMLVMEIGATYNSYYKAQSVLQRACNEAVQIATLDRYRADGMSAMSQQFFYLVFHNEVQNNMPQGFAWSSKSIQLSNSPATAKIEGTVTIPTLFSKYGFSDVTFHCKVSTENRRLEP